MKSKFAATTLHRFWLARLQIEYDEICCTYGVDLIPPVFEISRGEKQLGCWLSGTRSLRISEYLISTYPWNVTLQVLKHEMAHQYCSEVLQSKGVAHGEDFGRACSLLGVLPGFRGCSLVTKELLQEVGESVTGAAKGQDVCSKIEKLLALGASSNVHEAEVALQKASLLIEKYNVQQLISPDHLLYTVGVIETGKKQIATYRRHICTILQDFFFVRVVLSSSYSPLSDTMLKTIELMGTRENVAIATYCYDFLENRLARMWKDFRARTPRSGRSQKNSYYLGVVLGFSEKLQEQKVPEMKKTSTEPLPKELLVLEDRRLEAFVQMHYPRLRKTASRSARVDRNTYNEGVQAGRTLTFTKGVGDGCPSSPRRLE